MTGREDQYGTPDLDAEHSGGPPSLGRTFPSSWGYPEGDWMSEERAAWVRSHVEREVHTQHFRHLADVNGRLLAIARGAYLDSIREPRAG
jgi:hypothetical protein